jgi:hypothetical protein
MPEWIKTKDDEAKWSKAKKAQKKSYPRMADTVQKWKIVTAIFKKMNHGKV